MAQRTTRNRARALLAALLVLFLALSLGAAAQEYNAANPQNLTANNLAGKAALVMDSETGLVLFEKNGYRKTYPASTTKIMTCLVALENFPDLTRMVTVGPEAADIPGDSSVMKIRQGEAYPMIDLLYGMMITSGNDAAMTIAQAVGGTVENFVSMMNQRAASLGATNTNFVNPHGYHDEGHVSTAYDLALITREAMKNPTFRDIVAAKSYVLSATNQREKRRLETTYNMYVATSKFYYPDLIGVKTGTHTKAGHCFVGAAVKNGVEMISVTLKSTESGRWTDTARLLDYGATRYETLSFSELVALSPVYTSVQNASKEDPYNGVLQLQVAPSNQLSGYSLRCLPETRQTALDKFADSFTLEFTSDRVAPIQQGDILGDLLMEVNGQTLSATLVASRDVKAQPAPFSLESLAPGLAQALSRHTALFVIGLILLVILLILILRARAAARRRRRRMEMLRRRRAAYDRYHRK